jgi:hypothetical protein
MFSFKVNNLDTRALSICFSLKYLSSDFYQDMLFLKTLQQRAFDDVSLFITKFYIIVNMGRQ